MRSNEDVEQYLVDLGKPYEVIRDGVYKLNDDVEDVDDIIIVFNPPLVVFSVRLMKVPTERREEFFQMLLELNASELVAGAYGICDDDVVITDSLQSENLDFNEFQASIDSLSLAINEHYPVLSKFRQSAAS